MKIPSDVKDSLAELAKRDGKKNRFKTIVTPILIFCGVLGGVFGFAFLLDKPIFLVLSYVALALVITAACHDHWVLNSVIVPYVVIFPSAVLLDFFYGTWWSLALHVTNTILSLIIVNTRHDTSLILSLISSGMYAAWVYTISQWLDVPYYNILPYPPALQFCIILVAGIVPSITKTALNYRRKKKGHVFNCDKGICPL